MSTPAIHIPFALHFSYKGRRALDHVMFTVQAGSIHGFVGPNGAGKTTTLKILATLLPPKPGLVEIFGHNVVFQTREVRRLVGFMPDHFSLYRRMTVSEYLDFFAAAYGLSAERRRQVLDDVLALTEMGPRRDSAISTLSRGMQQRVALARVLVHDPKLLLLDEPASGLDPRARLELMDMLRTLRDMGKTIFISSHILSELSELCDAVTILDRGKVRYSGPMAELLHSRGAQGGTGLVLELASPCPALVAALSSDPDLCGVTEEDEGRRLRLVLTGSDRGPVLRHAVATQAPVLRLDEDRKRLDQVFLDLTSGGVG